MTSRSRSCWTRCRRQHRRLVGGAQLGLLRGRRARLRRGRRDAGEVPAVGQGPVRRGAGRARGGRRRAGRGAALADARRARRAHSDRRRAPPLLGVVDAAPGAGRARTSRTICRRSPMRRCSSRPTTTTRGSRRTRPRCRPWRASSRGSTRTWPGSRSSSASAGSSGASRSTGSIPGCFAELAARGLAWDIVVVTDEQARAVCALADAVPALRVVVDHLARPPVEGGPFEPWAQRVRELAARPNVALKVSIGIDALTVVGRVGRRRAVRRRTRSSASGRSG